MCGLSDVQQKGLSCLMGKLRAFGIHRGRVKRWVRDRDRKLESNESWMYLGRGMMSRSIGRTCQRVRDCRRARVQVHRASGIGMASGERVVSIGRIRSVSVIRVTERRMASDR